MTSRPPNMEKAIGSLEQHRMEAELDTILRANEAVFRTSVERKAIASFNNFWGRGTGV